MEQIDYDVDEFIDYCTSKNLSIKTIGSTDIDFIKRMILLPAENTKGKKDRYVFFSANSFILSKVFPLILIVLVIVKEYEEMWSVFLHK